MAKQTRLEKTGMSKREELVNKNLFSNSEDKIYSSDSKYALSNDESPWGKGDTVQNDVYLLPDENGSTTIMGKTLNTDSGGGLYDIKGSDALSSVETAWHGDSGRNWALKVNTYSKNEPYGQDSVDTSKNILQGQIYVTD